MMIEDQLITVEKAETFGLAQLTRAQTPDTQLRIGDGASSLRYIEWLTEEQKRITRHGDRKAEIVEDNTGKVSLWVDPVAA